MIRRCMLFLLLGSGMVQAQHCPWDCTGMILLKTDVTAAEFNKLNPVLVDGNKKIVIDTIYGTGKETQDTCWFLGYDDFMKYRTARTKVHYWYGYDTMFHFARGYYLIHYNYCRYKWDGRSNLFIRFNDPSAADTIHHYIEIPTDRRIHLHDYNREINGRRTAEIVSAVQPNIMEVHRREWKLLVK